MAFNTGLSGLRAAQVDLDVTGNNIANASTVGFKSSRAQFGDLYANGFLSSGSNPVGDGVTVQDIQQQFGQGNISFTDNGLDMAIDGDGFFVLSDGGETRYSRTGQFGIDKEGYVVNNQNMKVQGFTADDDGNISGVRGDLQIATDNLSPRRTTNLQTDLNLDSRESVLERRVKNFSYPTSAFTDGEQFTFSYADGSANSVVTMPNPITSANSVAEALRAAPGVNASGTTTATIASADTAGTNTLQDLIDNNTLEISVNGVTVDTSSVTTLDELATEISNLGNSSISASVNGSDLDIRDSSGESLSVVWGDASNTATVATQNQVEITTDRNVDGVTSTDGSPLVADFPTTDPEVINPFNPLDQRTYNHATSTTVYDSLGNSHELTQFYVKQPSPGNGVGQSEWSVYLQIDGELVGGTDSDPYTALFDQDGNLDSINGDPNGEIIVTDWVPKDPNGDPNGADGPPADPNAVVSPIPEPPTSSAFVIDLGDTTQYGAAFGVNDQQQNGYTTGRLSGLDVSDEGVIFARYTNGQSNELGQVALATFSNTDGLSPVGDTAWVETFESGQPVVGKPNTGTLGAIASSSVEESNVDLSEELVNLIIAQRNYQANAKTIETSDAVTQTIINLR
ncbi:flagellar hook protein FlgE [Marinobacter persicus]|uniref:flagellar hook protein FlgE n=1 Tax=Marinobacter persicus TaxID=930118 RepID=UPI000CEA7EBD|nr:flagellar hook protein FlgE [Marinobacter persicus]PPK58908.1 flagellar hook protein FlgE [Marinobacter persicus]